MKPIKYTYASPKRKSIGLPTKLAQPAKKEPINFSTVEDRTITPKKGLKRSLSADSDVVERLLKKRKQEFDSVDQINLVEEKRQFKINPNKEDPLEQHRGPFWNDLPLELFSRVADLLSHHDIVTLATACKSSGKLLQMDSLWRRFYFDATWTMEDHIKEQAELKKNRPLLGTNPDQIHFWRSKYRQTHVREWMSRLKTPVRTYSKRFQMMSPAKNRSLSRSTSDLTQQ